MKNKWVVFAVCALLLVAAPLFVQQFGHAWVRIMGVALLYVLLALGLNLIVGYAGLWLMTDEAHITNQRGAWSKDTWVLSREPERLTGFWLLSSPTADTVPPALAMSSRAAENLFWLSRYAERAEALVRHLRVASDRISEFAPGTNPADSAAVRAT